MPPRPSRRVFAGIRTPVGAAALPEGVIIHSVLSLLPPSLLVESSEWGPTTPVKGPNNRRGGPTEMIRHGKAKKEEQKRRCSSRDGVGDAERPHLGGRSPNHGRQRRSISSPGWRSGPRGERAPRGGLHGVPRLPRREGRAWPLGAAKGRQVSRRAKDRCEPLRQEAGGRMHGDGELDEPFPPGRCPLFGADKRQAITTDCRSDPDIQGSFPGSISNGATLRCKRSVAVSGRPRCSRSPQACEHVIS